MARLLRVHVVLSQCAVVPPPRCSLTPLKHWGDVSPSDARKHSRGLPRRMLFSTASQHRSSQATYCFDGPGRHPGCLADDREGREPMMFSAAWSLELSDSVSECLFSNCLKPMNCSAARPQAGIGRLPGSPATASYEAVAILQNQPRFQSVNQPVSVKAAGESPTPANEAASLVV